MLRLGNCVYRDLENELNEHAGLLYRYIGGQNIKSELDNHNKYIVVEHPGGTSGLTREILLGDFMTVDTYRGEWCPSNLTKEQRLQISSTAHGLDEKNHHYIESLLHILEYDGAEWGGEIDDIARLRCDGVTEVSYEENGILLWGSNLMSNQTNLEQHYNPNWLFTSGCTPRRQRLGGGGATTTNQQDHLYLPTE